MYEIPLHVRSNADHNDHDSDMTATKQVMNAEGALSDNDSVVISEREDDASNSEDGMIGDRLPANSDINTNYDPINKLEGAYVKLIDSQSNNIEALKMELAEVKSEVRKIPNKLHDSIKKYLDSNTKILQDVLHQLAENEDLKNQISHITSQLQSKSREIWSKREAANCRSHSDDFRSPSNNYRSRIPTSNVGVARDHIRQSPVSCHTAAPTQAGTSLLVHTDAPSQPGSAPVTHNATSNQGATTFPTPGTTRINHPQHAPPSPLLPGPGSVAHDATLNRAAMTSPVQGATRTDRPQHAVSSPLHRHTPKIQHVASPLTISHHAPPIPPIPAGSLPAPLPQPVPRETCRPDSNPPNAGEITVTEAQTTRIMDAEAVLIGDSTTKYVDRDCFMGRHMSCLQRASTSTTSKRFTSEWPIVENTKYAVLHVGVNDVRNGVANEIIENNIRHSLSNMHLKFPNAHIGFTEILYVGEECSRPDINGKIKSINETMANFCEQQNFTFVKHSSLQSPECDLYDDDVHINRSGGTATFVSDIHWAVGLHQRSRPNTDQRMYGRRLGQHTRGRYDDRVSSSGGPVTGDRGARPSWRQQRNDHANLDHMLQLLTINMLQSLQRDVWRHWIV